MPGRSGHRSAVPATKQKTYLKRFWIAFASFIVFLFLLFVSISLGLFGTMPSFEELENPKSNLATEIITSDNKLLGKYYIENRSNVHYQDLSPNIINALIATEDIRFEKHSGVDVKAVFRMVFGVFTGMSKGGASTITQQLAKNLFPRKKNPSKIYLAITKLKELLAASSHAGPSRSSGWRGAACPPSSAPWLQATCMSM